MCSRDLFKHCDSGPYVKFGGRLQAENRILLIGEAVQDIELDWIEHCRKSYITFRTVPASSLWFQNFCDVW
jgi:hypothetical protein